MHADRTNRVLLGVIGALMVIAGAGAILAGTGVFGDDVPDRALTDNAVGDFVGREGDWFWPVLAVVAIVLVALVTWWLLAILFGTQRIGQVELPTRDPSAATTVAASALAQAMTEEIKGYRGVSSARVVVVGTPQRPRLSVRVSADRGADVAALRDRIEAGALADARRALEYPDLPATVDLALRRSEGARVT